MRGESLFRVSSIILVLFLNSVFVADLLNLTNVAVGSPYDTKIYVDPASITGGNIGDTFTVSVKVANVTSLWSFDVKIRWPATALDFTTITNEGDFLKYGNPEHPDQSAHVTGTTKKNQTEGTLLCGYSLYGSLNVDVWTVSGSGTLFSVTFKIEKNNINLVLDLSLIHI